MLPEKYICILHRIALCLSWYFLNLNFSHQVQESKKSSLPVNTSIIWVSSYSSCIYFSKFSPTKNGWVRAFKTLWVEWCLHQKGHWTEMCSCCLCVWNSLSIQLIYGEGGVSLLTAWNWMQVFWEFGTWLFRIGCLCSFWCFLGSTYRIGWSFRFYRVSDLKNKNDTFSMKFKVPRYECEIYSIIFGGKNGLPGSIYWNRSLRMSG